ncbi:hypothetical protein C3489_34825 [Streptomyces sp. Ru71]|nr:hypothetical protein C3489_34825 [Streptomyces sp. Ru71]
MILRRGDEERHIPLAAIASVRSDGRAVEVRLTAPYGSKPAVHRIEDVSEAAGAAFAESVNGALADVESSAPDGSALVTVRGLEAGGRKRRRIRYGVGALILLLIAETVIVSVAGDPELSVPLWLGGLVVAGLGVPAARWLPFDKPDWRLRKHGVTVVAQYQGFIDGMHVYDYTDLDGKKFAYAHVAFRGEQVEIVYDPHDPLVGTERTFVLPRGTQLIPSLLAGIPAVIMLVLVLLLPVAALTG